MSKFVFDKHAEIWLYGAATTGVLTYNHLKAEGYNVLGFIDKRADEISELCGLEVYSINNLLANVKSLDDVVVILTIKNVFEHYRIANNLFKNGIKNIIYYPYESIKGIPSEEQQQLYNIMDKINKRQKLDKCILPKTSAINIVELKDQCVIGEEGEYIITYLPVNLLFTDRQQKTNKVLNIKDDDDIKELDKNIMTLMPHISFFAFLLGDDNYGYEKYIDFCEKAARRIDCFEITDRWRKNVFLNRVEVFENMNKEYEKHSDFFVKSAPCVSWNEKGYFNLISGKHRAAFLVAKGDSLIPVKIQKTEYENFLNYEEMQEVNSKRVLYDIEILPAPIEHPLFYNISCPSYAFWDKTLKSVCLMLSDSGFNFDETSEIFIDVDDMGYFARFFARMNINVKCADRKTKTFEMGKILNNVFKCSSIEVVGKDYDTSNCMLCISDSAIYDNKTVFFSKKIIAENEFKLISTGAYEGEPVWVYKRL